jgi:transcriptional regulator with XRE-family HTH domain
MPASSPRYAGHPVLLSLGKAIRQARLIRGISQEQLAHLSDIDRAYMSSVERGAQNPGVMTVARIALALDMKLANLLAEADL